jgi:hypothetical protein
MSEFRLAPEAEAELDDIWLYIARGGGSIDIATAWWRTFPLFRAFGEVSLLGPRT